MSPDVYISDDGGYTWARMLEGPHHYAILDSGGLIVAIAHSSQPVNVLECVGRGGWGSRQGEKGGLGVWGAVGVGEVPGLGGGHGDLVGGGVWRLRWTLRVSGWFLGLEMGSSGWEVWGGLRSWGGSGGGFGYGDLQGMEVGSWGSGCGVGGLWGLGCRRAADASRAPIAAGRWEWGGSIPSPEHPPLPPHLCRFSTDEGQCWYRYTFTKEPIFFTGLASEPGARSMNVSIWGFRSSFLSRKWVSYTIDFSQLLSRSCE